MGSNRDNAKPLQIWLNESERESIIDAAKSYDLNNGTFIRLVVAGALARGGGTVEQLINEGEKKHKGELRRRQRHNYERDWVIIRNSYFTAHNGDYVPADDDLGKQGWRLHRHAPAGLARGQEDRSLWWHLYKDTDPGWEPVPMAFARRDATRVASQYIEGRDE